MTNYDAVIEWQRDQAVFIDNRYSRGHVWRFDEGLEVPASASPHHVPLPMSVAAAVDPEEAFIASIASCHMLFFLSLAAKRGLVVDRYRDAATGSLGKNAAGKPAITRVTLRPAVKFSGAAPTDAELDALHHESHDLCYIASSITTDVRCEPVR